MTGPAEPGELEATADYLGTLMDRDQQGERVDIAVGPYTAYLMIGWCQMMSRHPELQPMHRNTARTYARLLARLFEGTPGEESIRQGEHPEWDPAPDDPGDPEVLAWLRELIDMERAGQAAPLRFSIMDGFIMALLLRQIIAAPFTTAGQQRLARGVVDQLAAAYAGTYGEHILASTPGGTR